MPHYKSRHVPLSDLKLFKLFQFPMQSFNKRDPSLSQVTIQNGLHEAAALAAMTLLLTAHRAVMNIGFTLRQKGLSTDARIALILGAVTAAWTGLVITSGLATDDKPCLHGFDQCTARLAYIPWILVVLFIFWIISYVDEILYLRSKVSRQRAEYSKLSRDPESQNKQAVVHRWSWPRHLRIWKMDCSHGPVNWAGSIRRPYRWALYGTMLSITLVVGYASMQQGQYTIGLLTIVGVILFIVGAAGDNKYAAAPHLYTSDTLRVMLHTRHKEGTSYILPSRTRGFDAVWGPKIENENKAIDEAVEKFDAEGGHAKGKTIPLSKVLVAFNAATELSTDDVNNLAGWLYEPENHPAMCQLACNRAPGIHLISFSVALALCHAEYLVFMKNGVIDKELATKTGTLRSARGSGLDLGKREKQVGSRLGLEGYQDVVRYVYRLLGEPVDEKALWPTSQCPNKSVVLDPCPDTIEEYVAQLWDKCFAMEDSTFEALSVFGTYYLADIGNDPENGFHMFPLRVKDREGDIVTWHIIWRQAWYGAVISQLTSMTPIIFSAFIAGIFQ
jgi:hypothetical protein